MDTFIKELHNLKIEDEVTLFHDYTIVVNHDEYAGDPREWDNLGTMVCFHRRYNLGDNHGFETPNVFFHVLSGLYPEVATMDLTNEQLERCKTVAHEKNIILPLYLYDHSGITMNTTGFSCPWDSGQVGCIYVSKEDVRREFNVSRVSNKLEERIRNMLVAEVETYDQYLCGKVYCYSIEKDGENVDCCCGFYGDPNESGLLENIIAAIEYDYINNPQQLEMFATA